MGRSVKSGDWLYICQRCGKWLYASQVKQEWNNLRVCPRCYEERQPQDFVTGVADDQSVPYSNPPGTASFLTINEVSPEDL